ncbi:spore coat protein, CotS family [Caloramator fervidus]|uniref:Spore coat protein, CotS family n=1 Tax=Caloramator fervidus TaxID=29344 RepID=A0A1H5SAF7_9CLOT|nr:CotS family spore coat protein [Caloramator fervidus]SEF47394.1 spore coat protein, CotS family [Caloramator fervidus]
MKNKNRITKLKKINNEKLKKLTSILKSKYNIEPKDIEKIRSVYKIYTKDKIYCLKEFKHNNKKVIIGFYFTKYLKDNGFNNIADYFKTIDGREVVKTDKKYYYLTSWINGKECDFSDISVLRKAVELLAKFHLKAKGFEVKSIKLKDNFNNNWEKKILKICDDLREFKRLIENKKIKTQFDEKYLELIEDNLNLCLEILNIFKKEKYKKLCERAKKEKYVCHDSFYYQNLLLDDNNELYLIDLDSIVYDLPAYDLAKFIRRIMNKKRYSWNYEIAKEMLKIYDEIRKIEDDEYEIILGYLLIPHRFWKLGKKRYFKNKEWSEEKYLRKLEKEIRYKEKKEEFANKFINEFLAKEKSS